MALFTTAVDTLQKVFGELVTYTPVVGSPSQIYAVYRNPTEEDFIGGSGVITESIVFEVALADIALPVKEDTITRPDASVYRVRVTPTLDEAQTTWLLDVQRTSP